MARPYNFSHGVWHLPGGQKEPGQAALWLFEKLDRIATANKPTLFVKEQAILPHDQKNRKKQFAINAQQRVLMYGLHVAVEMVAFKHGIECTEIEPRTLKKQFTGKGNATKEDMIFYCKLMGQKVYDDNEADAIALMSVTARNRIPDWPF